MSASHSEHQSRRARRGRISKLDPNDTSDRFTLRDAIVTDSDAEVRAEAILRLDASAARSLLPYVRDATSDPAMLVREAAFVALGRAADAASLSRAASACQSDRGFRVRRMALLFAARTCGAEALPLLALASRDPFWRVRVTARRAGAALDASVDARAIESETERESESEFSRATPIPGVDDPDPAVVTARLGRMRGQIDPLLLVGVLGHAHQALRRIAVKEISARGDVATLRRVTRWLSDERVPYGPTAAEATLARSGSRAVSLAREMVEQAAEFSPGAIAWAVRTARDAPIWSQMEAFLAHGDARVRRAAVMRAPEVAPDRGVLFAVMSKLLEDDDEETRIRAATWLARTGSRDGRAALCRLDPHNQPTLVRSILVDVHTNDRDALRAFVDDPHGGVRAGALSALSALGALTAAERRHLEHDPDPWIRHAVFVPEQALSAISDPSPLVRKAASECLDDSADWAESAATVRDPDPSLRARAAAILGDVTTLGATRTLLILARDSDFGVRSIAIAALSERRDSVRHLLEVADGDIPLSVPERMAAYTLFRLDEDRGTPWKETDPRVLAHLALLEDVIENRRPDVSESLPSLVPIAPKSKEPTHHRSLGKTGISVHPFGISGAHGLREGDFAIAEDRGVNLFFWEPSHRELTRFLRARRSNNAVVVAGTYHADLPSIERDVVRTLRALKKETIDVFLAYWTRSIARIDEVAGILESLADRGLIRATGLSTHDRSLACEAADRGFDVVMVRHNAAHRGAESTVFPHCIERGTGVLTFSNLCYGRMLHRSPAVLSAKVTAPDCYRYSLSQPGVGACIAAPRRYSELMENLSVMESPLMNAERQAEMRAHGDHVYARSKAWSAETWKVAEHPSAHAHVDESLSDWIDRPESLSTDL